MTLNLKDLKIVFGFFYNLTPQLLTFNTLTTAWIPLPVFDLIGVCFYMHTNSQLIRDVDTVASLPSATSTKYALMERGVDWFL